MRSYRDIPNRFGPVNWSVPEIKEIRELYGVVGREAWEMCESLYGPQRTNLTDLIEERLYQHLPENEAAIATKCVANVIAEVLKEQP